MVNIGLGNGLLPDSTQLLSEPTLTYHHWGLMALIHLRVGSQEMFKMFILEPTLKITN